jgi:hypothetical protein
MKIDVGYVCGRLDYDFDIGWLTWKPLIEDTKENRRWNTRYAGKRAGSKNKRGYRQITLRGYIYPEHRIIWLWVRGQFPEQQIDHRNGIKDDNRWINLREATCSENHQNRSKHQNNSTGFTGVSFVDKRQKFQAQIRVNNKCTHLGYFDTAEEAHEYYLVAKTRYHVFQPVPREEI